MTFAQRAAGAALVLACALPAHAANDRFWKEAGPMNGFEPVTDATYRKECGSCHTAYLPGLFPARSWELHMSRLDKHFGEIVSLSPDAHAHIRNYLAQHAADRSKFEGSLTFMERIEPDKTPYRFNDVPIFREMHRIIREVIDRRAKVRVRNTTNCQACHQMAEEGSFGTEEMFIPGLTPEARKAKPAR